MVVKVGEVGVGVGVRGVRMEKKQIKLLVSIHKKHLLVTIDVPKHIRRCRFTVSVQRYNSEN